MKRQEKSRFEGEGLRRLLFASTQDFTKKRKEEPGISFHAKPQQGLFVYDIERGHELVERFPAETWDSWNNGWSGLAAHAASGRLFQLLDGVGLRAFDLKTKALLWERGKETEADRRWASDTGKDVRERSFQYVDRRFCVTKDGRHLIVPDRDSGKREKEGKPLGLGIPVLRVLETATGEWVKNIALGGLVSEGVAKTPSPHNAQAMQRWIYASMWNDGRVFCIDPQSLEIERTLGPVDLREDLRPSDEAVSDAQRLGTEVAHESQSIQHFSVHPDERYVYVEPVKAFGVGVIDVESGEFLGHWAIPEPEPGSLRARRMALPGAEANQLHSKANHGIAYRPFHDEVWVTDDRWGFLHVWDVSREVPRYDGYVPLFDDIEQPMYDFSWVNFDMNGDFAYASNKVVDARQRKVVAELHGLNESSIEIQFKGQEVLRTCHEMGSGIDTWQEGFGPRELAGR